MTDLTDQLDKIIQKAALDGALTADAVDQFHSLVKQCDSQAEELRKLNKVNTDLIDARDKLKVELNLAQTLNKVAAEAEIAMIERECNITTLELTAAHEKQRVQDHINMFTTVFRNSVLRKEVMTPLEATRMDQGMSGQGGYASKDTVEEEEK
jgi:hypothetical protein